MLQGNIKGVQHLGLPVSDIAGSIKWYKDILGFETIYETRIPGSEGEVSVAFVALKGFVIEMYQLSGQELEEIRGRGQGHIDHLAFDVDNLDEVGEKLKEKGIEPIEGPNFLPFWEKGVRYLTILGPDHEKIEFNQKL
jgi:lactoylglutathione lyase